MAIVSWLQTVLDKEGKPYEVVHYPPVFTAHELSQREEFSRAHVAKVVIVIADERPIQLVLPANKEVDLLRLRLILGAADVRLATEAEMAKLFADCELGAEPPLPHVKGIDLWMDDSMKVEGDILFQGGTHRDGVIIAFKDWFGLALPRTADFAV